VGAHNGQIIVRDDSYGPAPLAYSAALTGTGSAIPVVTTIPPTVTTTPTATTAPPVPLSLTIDPPVVDFDPTTVGAAAPTEIARVRNNGTTPNTVSTVSIGGANAADFDIVGTNCPGATLAPGATCDVELEFEPGDSGDRTAELDATGGGGSSASATLRGSALYAPTLEASPPVVAGGQVTTLIGDGFPPSTSIELTWALVPATFTVTSDASGSFRHPVLVMAHSLLGPQLVSATAQPGVFEQVDADLLVVAGTVQPQATANLVQLATNHVSRG
jgi:hypothetical protein